MTWEIYEECGKDIIIRLNNDEGVREIDIFRENINLSEEYYTVQEVADSVVYIYKVFAKELEDDDIEFIEEYLNKINELIEEEYEWLKYEDEECC